MRRAPTFHKDVPRLPPTAATVTLVQRLKELRLRTVQDTCVANFERLHSFHSRREEYSVSTVVLVQGRLAVRLTASLQGEYVVVRGAVDVDAARPVIALNVRLQQSPSNPHKVLLL